MNLTETRQALEQLQIHPSKALGQNFLIDGNIARIILDAADLGAEDTALEIGPGLGALTDKILERVERVVSVERDKRLAEYLRTKFATRRDFKLLTADALEVDYQKLGLRNLGYKLVSNLPYSVGTLLLLHLIENNPRPTKIVVTVQREVAERLVAVPRTKDYGAASVLAQLFYSVRIMHRVSPTCFWPAPKVESAVVAMDWFPHPRLKLSRAGDVMRLAHAGFAQRRKMLRGRVCSEVALCKIGATPTARAEELSIEQWIKLADDSITRTMPK